MNYRRLLLTGPLSVLLGLAPCHAADGPIRLTTSSSTSASGLMDTLIPAFEADTGYRVELEVYGTGRALRNGREGKADVLIVHAPESERHFMAQGHGLTRRPLMRNEFLLAGPAPDPAGIAGASDAAEAFRRIAEHRAPFVSRGDDSGTHKKELAIWSRSGIEPYGKWYIEYGRGMGDTLDYADNLGAYVLVDLGTWLARRARLALFPLLRGDRLLHNPYHIILVDPGRHPEVNRRGAQRLLQWMVSERGQGIIRTFAVGGEHAFTPAAVP